MTTTVEQNGLSGRDLRIKLFDLMKSKGIVDNVKVKERHVKEKIQEKNLF